MVEGAALLHRGQLGLLSAGDHPWKMDSCNLAGRKSDDGFHPMEDHGGCSACGDSLRGRVPLFPQDDAEGDFFSASVLVVFNVAAGFITSQMQPVASVYFGWMTGWSGFVSSLLFSLTQKPWLASIVQWVLPPYIFVLFGRKDEKEHEEK